MTTYTIQRCRAKDPHTCPYHSNVLKMQEAKARFDFDAFADARDELKKQLETNAFAREEQQREENNQQGVDVSFESVAQDQASLDAHLEQEATTVVRRTTRRADTAQPTNSLGVPTRHSYTPAERVNVPEPSYGSWRGAKYDPYMAPSAVVTNIKRDFATAQQQGYLPKGLTISAQKDQYSGGYGINVEISGVRDKDRYTHNSDGSINGENEAAKLVRKRIEGIVDAYNFYTRSGPFEDYPSINFGGRVNILNDRDQAANAAEKAAAAEARHAKKVAVALKNEYTTDGKVALQRRGFQLTGTTRDGKGVGRIPGTRFIAIVQPGTDGQDSYQMYNLHNFTEKTANAFESQFAHMSAASIRRKFKRQQFIA